MFRLSRPAWNNVIIFSILAFILLINLSQQGAFESEPEYLDTEQALIGENVIVALEIDQQLKIERIGQAWRAQPAKISGQRLAQMMASWHIVQGQAVAPQTGLNPNQAVIISIWFAGRQDASFYSLYLLEDALLVLNHDNQQWFQLARPLYFQLLPKALKL